MIFRELENYFYSNLSLHDDLRLEVVVLQVALEVEDRQLIRLLQAEELAERGVRIDVLLVHQALGLRVVAHLLGHRRAGEQGALRDAEELAERIGHGRGAREDRLLLGDSRAVLVGRRRLAATAALGGLLHLLRQLLLELLHRRAELADELPGILNLLGERRELGDNVNLVGLDARNRGGNGYGSRRNRGGNDRRCSGDGGRLDGLRGLGRGRRRGNGGGRRLGLLRGALNGG